jgi:hypothetical protein
LPHWCRCCCFHHCHCCLVHIVVASEVRYSIDEY